MKKLFALIIALTSAFFVFSQDSTVIDPLTDTVPQVIDTLPITNPEDLIDQTESENRQKS